LTAASVLVIRSKEGNVVSKSTREGSMTDVVRKVVSDALSIWSAETSDLIVIRDQYPVSIKLPISKEQYELYSKHDMQRTSDGSIVFHLPVYVISFDNEWREDDYVDKEVFIVAPAVDQKVDEVITELAIEATKPDGGESECEDEGCGCEECEN